MTAQQATAEVFWTAFQALPKTAKEDFLVHLACDPGMQHDFIDIALIAKRRSEKCRPFAEYLAGHSGKK